MASNEDLRKANTAKKDEFYTSLDVISSEMRHHKKSFKDKIVLCDCDDPYESNFFKYFALNFNKLGLKKLIATCYKGSPVIATQLSWIPGMDASKELNAKANKKAYKIEINEVPDVNGDGAVDITDVEWLIKNGDNVLTELEGDGDFRSEECIELLKESNIVVTNPPFSLFREYVARLIEYDKEFLIIGSINAITYKEFFPLIMDNKVWMGASIHSGDREFRVPDDYPLNAAGCRIDEEGNKYIRVKGVRWWTNLDYALRHEELDLYKKYNPEEYPRFDNYDAINIDVTADIPRDYYGVMGVPITFLDKYSPDQFKILGKTDRQAIYGYRTKVYTPEDSPKYNDLNRGPTLIKNGELKAMYQRLFIQRKDS